MTATLPASSLHGHIMSDTEWTQILTAITAAANIEVFNSRAISATTNSISYGNITGASQTFTKHYGSSTSDVGVIAFTSHRHSTASIKATFGVFDGTADHDTHAGINLTAGKHYYWGGMAKITGLAAGAFTFQMRWKMSSTTGTATIDTNDTLSLYVVELAK